MLGFWRFVLATLVVVGHLWGHWWAAAYAVFSFYVISGFLMTLILNETYGFDRTGFVTFWRARLLRLLPSYWLGCGLTLALILVLSQQVTQAWNPKMVVPSSLHEVLSNVLLIGIPHPSPDVTLSGISVTPEFFSTLVPPAWALSIELTFYLLLSLYFARSAKRCLALGAFGAIYAAWSFSTDFPKYFSYYFVPAGALPFAVGGLAYFALRLEWVKSLARHNAVLVVSLGLYALNFVLAHNYSQFRPPLLYWNILCSAFLVAALMQVHVPRLLRRTDSFLGDLAYPIYLFHWQVGLVVSLATGIARGTLELFLYSVPIVILLAMLDRRVLSGPIDRWRRRTETATPVTGAPRLS